MKTASIKRKTPILFFIVCFFLMGAVIILSINTGEIQLSVSEVLRTLMGKGELSHYFIIVGFRLPRIIIAILIGIGLSVSGVLLQSVTKNDLAEPGLLGITSGASIGVLLFLSFFIGKTYVETEGMIYFLPFCALAGGFAAAFFVYLLAVRNGELRPMSLILAGVAVNAALHAVITALSIQLASGNFEFAMQWLLGSLWGVSWSFVFAILPWVLLIVPLAWYRSRMLNVFLVNDDLAIGLGVQLKKERKRIIAMAVMLAAICVAVGGGIAFLGLIAPHIAKRIVGPHHQVLIPAAAMIGALLLLAADYVVRTAANIQELPVGILVSGLGAPYFLYLLMKINK